MSLVIKEIKNKVAILTLNRPDKFNAFNREMALTLQKLLDDCTTDDSVRAVLLTAAGKAFCAGQDLGEVTGENPVGFDKILVEHYNPIIEKIRSIEKPVVCAVNGVAAGAGASLAICCDIVLASENATFIQAFSKIGLIPDSGSTFFLPRLVGFQKAMGLMMLADKVTAQEAEKMGMIYKSLPSESFVEESFKLTESLANMPTKALGLIKKAMNASMQNSLFEQLQYEDKLQFIAAHTQDYQEGVNAFIQKRTPEFKGL
jgi:2-(1,2-epoxy-1,2-dihydrophenyl)acetyl-CoA isomerase